MTLILNRRGFLQTASGGLVLSVIRPVGVNAQDFDGTFPDMHAACHVIVRQFGSERCVWGSDFRCELWGPKVTYRQHLDIFRHKLGLDTATKSAVLGETARRLWFSTPS